MLFDFNDIPQNSTPNKSEIQVVGRCTSPVQDRSVTTSTPFLLGLPYLADNVLTQTARDLDATVLLSANAFSKWRRDAIGIPTWYGFNKGPLRHARGLKICLDSAGFVAAVKYRRFPWSVAQYMDLCEAAPWEWFASMDWCVEPEVAPNEELVLNRISGTIRLNYACSRE